MHSTKKGEKIICNQSYYFILHSCRVFTFFMTPFTARFCGKYDMQIIWWHKLSNLINSKKHIMNVWAV